MAIVSYSQNFEDVMLWRALKVVENGFYVDVGANEPEHFSVTKLFYDNNWNGINIEPVPKVFKMLEEERKNDINLNIAISAQTKEINLFISNIYDKGLSTTNVNVVEESKYKDSFNEKIVIEAKTLDEVFEENNVSEVHFLKVDVEGAEKDVLESFSFEEIRPWIIVIEATKPTTQIDVSNEWEYLLLEKNYIFAYFDGLNKFYIAKEKEELLQYFKYPPNVFDDFKLSNFVSNEIKLADVESMLEQAGAKLVETESMLEQTGAKLVETESMLNSIYSSLSWRITKPLRIFKKFYKQKINNEKK